MPNILKEKISPTHHSSHDNKVIETIVYNIHNIWKVKQGLQLKGLRSKCFENRVNVKCLFSVSNLPSSIPHRFIEIQIKNNVSIRNSFSL